MKLVFQNASGIERTIADVKDQDEAMIKIKKFCYERDFNIPYTRVWEESGVKVFDVGSWSDFFKLYHNDSE